MHLGVGQHRDLLLCDDDCVADGTVASLGVSDGCAGSCNVSVRLGGMPGSGPDGRRFRNRGVSVGIGEISVTVGTLPILVVAVLRTGRVGCCMVI